MSSFDPTGIINWFIGLFQTLIQDIMNGLVQLYQATIGGLGMGLSTMFVSWGQSLAGYGVWGPVMVVVSLAAAFGIGYGALTVIGVERDIVGAERDI